MSGFPADRLVALVAEHSTVSEMGGALDIRWAQLGWEAVLHGAELAAAEQAALEEAAQPAVAR